MRSKAIANYRAPPRSVQLESIAWLLRSREGYRYSEIKKALGAIGEEFRFEFVLGDFVYDLFLPRIGVLVEFDGKEHAEPKTARIDAIKNEVAHDAGLALKRVCVEGIDGAFPPRLLFEIIELN